MGYSIKLDRYLHVRAKYSLTGRIVEDPDAAAEMSVWCWKADHDILTDPRTNVVDPVNEPVVSSQPKTLSYKADVTYLKLSARP